MDHQPAGECPKADGSITDRAAECRKRCIPMQYCSPWNVSLNECIGEDWHQVSIAVIAEKVHKVRKSFLRPDLAIRERELGSVLKVPKVPTVSPIRPL